MMVKYDNKQQSLNAEHPVAAQGLDLVDGKMRLRVRKEYAWMSGAFIATNEVRYVYDGMLVIQERNGNNLPVATYTRGLDLSGGRQGAGGIGGLLARTDNALWNGSGTDGAHMFYSADGNGNITCLLNSKQIVVGRYVYDPYGNTLSLSGPQAEANPYRFSSKEYMGNSGLYYYGYRFYEPSLQRWVNRDPADDWGSIVNYLQNVRDSDIDFNLYRFVGNAPSIYVDEFGLKWHAGGKWDEKDDSIVCDDKGGIRPALTKNSQCGCNPAKKCRIEHEMSHAADVLAEKPDICKGKKDGTQIYTYSTKQNNASERKGYDKEIDCIRKNAAEFNKQCLESSEDSIKRLEKDRKRYE